MARYSAQYRNSVLRELLPPQSKTVGEVAAEFGISTSTIYGWMAKMNDGTLQVDDGAQGARHESMDGEYEFLGTRSEFSMISAPRSDGRISVEQLAPQEKPLATSEDLRFVSREELKDREWDNQTKRWERPAIDRELLKELNKRSALEGSVRVIVHIGLIVATAWLTVVAWRQSILLGVVPFLAYCWLVGFLNGIEHEMRHKIVFPRRLEWISEVVYFLIHTLWKMGTRIQRVSHMTHHRYTMVRGVDPEPAFPEDLDTKWVRRELLGMLVTVLTLGVVDLFRFLWGLAQRSVGKLDPMIEAQCTEKDLTYIRWVTQSRRSTIGPSTLP